MVREPVDLLHSLHAKMLSYGQEDVPDLHNAIEAEPARRRRRQFPKGLFWPSSLYYSEWVRLGEQLERYRGLFPASRMKVVVYRFPLISKVLAVGGDLRVKNLVPLDPGVRRELMARFRPDAEELSRVLQRDRLTLWGHV